MKAEREIEEGLKEEKRRRRIEKKEEQKNKEQEKTKSDRNEIIRYIAKEEMSLNEELF